MCEIAVMDPKRCTEDIIMQLAYMFHEEQGDGIGVLMVYDDGEKYSYDVYKSVAPHWFTLSEFVHRTFDDAWRIVIHGRAKTTGDVARRNAHPLDCSCDHEECEFEYVVHNGSVRSHETIRKDLTKKGHTFRTDVDSEVLAHSIGTLPDSIQDHTQYTYRPRGNLNYLLFSENGILVRVGRRYYLTDDMILTCSKSKFAEPEEHGITGTVSENQYLLAKPGEEITTKGYSHTGNRSTTTYSGGRTSTSTGSSRTKQSSWSSDADESWDHSEAYDTYTIEYEDLCDTFDHVAAIQVAPGVIRLIEKEKMKVTYVFRDENPDLYYWYSKDEPPIVEPEPEEEADEEEDITQEVVETTAKTIANLTVEEMADLDAEAAAAFQRAKEQAGD